MVSWETAADAAVWNAYPVERLLVVQQHSTVFVALALFPFSSAEDHAIVLLACHPEKIDLPEELVHSGWGSPLSSVQF